MGAALELWEEQVPVIEAVRAEFNAGHRAVMMQAPTGFGKTTCFTFIALHASELGNTVHIMVHRDELIIQVSERLARYGIEHGIIAADYEDSPWYKVQICSIQTYVNRIKKGTVKPADLYVIDEAHHSSASTYVEIWEFAPEAHILGVTATPARTDGLPLNTYEKKTGRKFPDGTDETITKSLYTSMVCGPPVEELIPRRLVRPKHYMPEEPLDISKVRLKKNGDLNTDDLVAVYEKTPKYLASGPVWYKKLCPGTPAVAFCANLKHCQRTAEEFVKAGVSAAVIDGTMSKPKRRQLIQRFKDGDVQVLCSANLITEGFDIPAIGCVILLRHTKSLIYYLQAIGRGLRKDEGKEFCIIIDIARLADQPNFGFCNSPRQWNLEGKPVQTEDRGSAQCIKCGIWTINVKFCPHCGHELLEKRSSGGGGSLEEYTCDEDGQMRLYINEAERLAEKVEAAKIRAQRKSEERAASIATDPYDAYVRLAKARGYPNPERWALLRIQMKEKKNYRDGKFKPDFKKMR